MTLLAPDLADLMNYHGLVEFYPDYFFGILLYPLVPWRQQGR